MNAPAFIPPTGVSKLDTMDHNIRNKIRHSLIHSELTTTVENSLPLGGEFAILLSNQPFFPKDITSEALGAFVDTMANQDQPGWDSNDSLYIIDECDLLSPSSGNIYIFNIMSDSTQCVDGVKYLVKHKDAVMDTVVSYVDTLFRVLLPDPDSIYTETNSEGHLGQVAVPGITSYSSVLDTGRIFLLTDYGLRYIVPRFSFNPTGDSERFFSRYDAIDIKSSITFRVSSGVFGATENDIVILNPNGGENWKEGSVETIRWKTYGEIEFVDVYYFVDDATENFPDNLDVEITDPFIASDNSWFSIKILKEDGSDSTFANRIENIDSLEWTVDISEAIPSFYSDSVRIIIKDSDSEVFDVSGWYFSVSEDGLLGRTSMGNAVINRGKLKRPGKSR